MISYQPSCSINWMIKHTLKTRKYNISSNELNLLSLISGAGEDYPRCDHTLYLSLKENKEDNTYSFIYSLCDPRGNNLQTNSIVNRQVKYEAVLDALYFLLVTLIKSAAMDGSKLLLVTPHIDLTLFDDLINKSKAINFIKELLDIACIDMYIVETHDCYVEQIDKLEKEYFEVL